MDRYSHTASKQTVCRLATTPSVPRSYRGAGAAAHHRVRKTSQRATLMIKFTPHADGGRPRSCIARRSGLFDHESGR